MSENIRAKIFSVYLQPWTLVPSMATKEVPYLKKLSQEVNTGVAQKTEKEYSSDANCSPHMRKSWKAYLSAVLPHAQRQISDFMLACIAEGKHFENEEEGPFRRGMTLSGDLTHAEMFKIRSYGRHEDLSSDGKRTAQEATEVNESSTINEVQSSKTKPTARRMVATTSLAVQLAEVSGAQSTQPVTQHTLRRHCYQKPARTDDDDSGDRDCAN